MRERHRSDKPTPPVGHCASLWSWVEPWTRDSTALPIGKMVARALAALGAHSLLMRAINPAPVNLTLTGYRFGARRDSTELLVLARTLQISKVSGIRLEKRTPGPPDDPEGPGDAAVARTIWSVELRAVLDEGGVVWNSWRVAVHCRVNTGSRERPWEMPVLSFETPAWLSSAAQQSYLRSLLPSSGGCSPVDKREGRGSARLSSRGGLTCFRQLRAAGFL
uniref:Uncharacterized protein n=1 Tax=Timema douglasi TaxID=61478 RepID=A0A7R8VBF3_TIMDO|nr:unnamed protein product [Timema douglasi]